MPLTLKIVTPEREVYSESVSSVVLPTQSGDVGILPGHIPLMTLLEAGELQVVRGDGENALEYLAVDKGFAEVQGDQVTVLTEAAIDIQNIDLSEVEDARERAESALRKAEKASMDPDEIERLEAQVRFSIAQQLTKKKRRN